MKILDVTFGFHTIGKKSFDEQANLIELQKLGHHVAMVTTDKSREIVEMKKEILNKDSQMFREDEPTEIFGIPVYILHCNITKIWYCKNASKLADKIVRDYDVVHIRNWYNHLSIVFYKAARKYGIPFVFTTYGMFDPTARKKYFRRTKLMIDEIYTKNMIKDAAALHSLGESDTKEFIKFGADPKKIFRIDLGLIIQDYEITERTDVLERLDVNKDTKPFALYLGRIVKKKAAHLLLKSFARLNHKNLNLVIVGMGDKSYEKKLRQLVQDLELENSVKFAGPVFGNEKSQLLESAKFFVLPSYSDIHPVAAAEALAFGLPVLITKNCDFPEIGEYNAGIIIEPNVDSIYQGLIKMTEDDNRLQIFSKNAKRLAYDKFLFKGKVYEYVKMYEYAMKNKL